MSVYTYLRMVAGPQPGTHFLLNPDAENVIGRGRDCSIVLSDPLCSRVHAVMVCRDSNWQIRDGESRNGTYVNGRPIQESPLANDDRVRVGSTEFTFRESPDPPSGSGSSVRAGRGNLVQQVPVSAQASLATVRGLPEGEPVRDLLLLHQLSLRLLAAHEAGPVAQAVLETLRSRLRCDLVALLEPAGAAQVRARLVLPPEANDSGWLQASLAHAVLEDGQAVWLASRGGDSNRPGGRSGDALCVPLACDNQVLAAVLAVRQAPSFQQSDFDFAIGLAQIAGMAWQRVESKAAPPARKEGGAGGPSEAHSNEAELNLAENERRLIERALAQAGGRVPDAAKLLGISRATLYRKLAELDLK